MTLSEEGQNRVLSLWQESCAALLRYAKKELGQTAPTGEAEDIVSDAFELLMIHYERYENLTDEQIKSILIRTVRNLAVDAYRRPEIRRDSSWRSGRRRRSSCPRTTSAG